MKEPKGRGVTTVSLVLLLAAGCRGGQGDDGLSLDPANAWYSEFQEAYQRAASEMERGILKDGVVSDAEYNEVIEARRSCYRDLGVEYEHSTDRLNFGGSTIHGDASTTQEELDAAAAKCDPIGQEVDIIYQNVLRNPNNEHFPDLVVECLKGLGLVPADLTGDEWMAMDHGDVPASPESDLCFVDPKGLMK